MDDRFLEDLKSRIEILEVIKRYHHHPIKKSGKNHMTRSPFRNERTPSFSISTEKQMWYDFGNSEGGDLISFVEKIENCGFQEAVDILADMAGMEIPETFKEKKGTPIEVKKDLYALHKKASEFFAKQLQKSEIAQKYCSDREISSEMIKNWNLGFGGNEKDGLTKYLLKSGFAEKQIAESGVAFERSFGDQKMMDRFHGRLMIPIQEPQNGEIIAFSGREILGQEKTAKYINSPENPVYHKGSTLFGLFQARKPIKETDQIVLVEGNFDVVFAHENGFKNVVATCGTSLSEEHLRMIKRFSKNLYLAFDSDIAGKKATLRSTEMCLKMELNPFIVEILEAKDFGEFLEKPENAKLLQKIIKDAPKALDFFFAKFSQKNLDGTVEGEKKFLDAFFYFLKLITRPIEVDDFLEKIAKKLNRQKSIIQSEFNNFSTQKTEYLKPKYKKETEIRFSREENFIGFLFSNWSFFEKTLLAQKEKILNLFLEPIPKGLLTKKLEKTDFSETEQKQVLGWEMFCENLYEDNDVDLLKREFGIFAKQLQEDGSKKEKGQTTAEKEFIKQYNLKTKNL